MFRRQLYVCATAFALLMQAQEASTLAITGNAVKNPLSLTAAQIAAMPRATLETKSDGVTVSYEGVWLHELLKAAGAPGGAELRGKALASYIVASAGDGYQALYSIAEIDPLFTDNQVLVADKANGKPLTAAQGPFRLVAPKDKRGARSVRMLQKIEVVSLRP